LALPKKRIKRCLKAFQLQLVGDVLGELHRKAEIRWYSASPTGIGRRQVRPVERAVDLDGTQPRGVALQVAALLRERLGLLARQAPARASHVDHHGTPWIAVAVMESPGALVVPWTLPPARWLT